VKIYPASGTCGEMEKHHHIVAVDRSQMGFGENTATISVTSNGGSETIHVRAIRLVPGCNDAPEAPRTPSPSNLATGLSTDTDIAWDGGDSQCSQLTARYDIYFGATSPPPFDHTDTLKVWDPGPLNTNTIYYWRVVAKDANGRTTSPEWQFRTVCDLGPSSVTLVSPANNAINVSVIDDLSWRGGDSRCAGLTATYDLYFGTSSPPPFHHSTTIKYWDAGILSKSTTYYWRVVARDDNGSDSSPEWTFTTVAQPCTTPPSNVSLQSPAQGATDVPLDQDLSWTGGNSQCEGQTATYDVYFGTTTPPPLHHNNGSGKTWDPGALAYNTIYYWRIVAKDAGGSVTSSERWFRTPCNLNPGALTLVGPANGSTGVSVDANLLWGGGTSQCPGLTATYDVYFGTTSSPPFDHNNGSTKNWDPGTLVRKHQVLLEDCREGREWRNIGPGVELHHGGGGVHRAAGHGVVVITGRRRDRPCRSTLIFRGRVGNSQLHRTHRHLRRVFRPQPRRLRKSAIAAPRNRGIRASCFRSRPTTGRSSRRMRMARHHRRCATSPPACSRAPATRNAPTIVSPGQRRDRCVGRWPTSRGAEATAHAPA
jgi:hypothetical protein